MKKLQLGVGLSGLFYGAVMVIGLSTLVSCENSDQLGLEITPPGERFAYHIDSVTSIRMSTIRQDSLTSDKRSAVLLGATQNESFGSTKASFMSQLRLSSNDVDFGDDIKLDSVILFLKYLNYYGDTSLVHNLRIYELTDDLYFDSTYYSNHDISNFYDPANTIAEISYTPRPSLDSLAITLDESIGLKILEADTANLDNNTVFLEYFKGLYFEADVAGSPGAMIYYNLAGGESRMSLYYSNAEDDSLKYDVLINTNCTWVNLYEHDYSQSEVSEVLTDTLYDNDIVYAQAMAGLRASVQIEFSDSLLAMADLGIAINKAELIFPIKEEYNSEVFTKPVSLSVFGSKTDGTNEFIDDILLGQAYYGGSFKEDKNAYVFNIARHVQRILDPSPDDRLTNNGLFLVVNNARVSGNHVALDNSQSETGAHLIITYTVIN
ncbi:MAG: DUF4270 domain-containing protein [Bacteroidetes bacterium]|jgi:hypothetical protein|nr:DUF4270 domain-containing protein [Bacteroidota bacterium]MBT7466570.1 DUF4270 domain-containing protein [Bacteroidota bacterium]